jgi:hypothetical protein
VGADGHQFASLGRAAFALRVPVHPQGAEVEREFMSFEVSRFMSRETSKLTTMKTTVEITLKFILVMPLPKR